MLGTAFPHGLGFFIALYGALATLALVAHVAWIRQIYQGARNSGWALPVKILAISAAVATPVLGFYVVAILQFLQKKQGRKAAKKSGWGLPALALLAVCSCAAIAVLRYTPETRSWSILQQSFFGFFALYAAMQAVIYMAAYVFGWSRHGPCATRTHLISIVILLMSAFVA
jgi:hypothetical protein